MSLGAALAASLLVIPAITGHAAAADDWIKVGSGKTEGVSGIAPYGSDWLIVRDNKKSDQNRVSKLSLSGSTPKVTALDWSGDDPDDLEALDAIPGTSNRFVAVTSEGKAYAITAGSSKVTMDGKVSLPAGSGEFEGFALRVLSGKTVAVWATRGEVGVPGKFYAATFDATKLTFGKVSSAAFTAPYPTSDVRHISDAKITSTGEVLSAAASDGGDTGPFNSALYRAAKVTVADSTATITVDAKAAPLQKFSGHKVEAVSCTVLGTDDEDNGGYVRSGSFC